MAVSRTCCWTLLTLAAAVATCAFSVAVADDRRAPPPKFSESDTSSIFFPQLSDAIRGKRPTLSEMRAAATAASKTLNSPKAGAAAAPAGGTWDKLISPASIEDEVKRVKLHFDGVITAPGPFKSGGYQDARTDLSILSVMFAVINEYNGEVRWKDQAIAARDILARTAFNCKAGSSQVYNEAKARKDDLQNLVSGSGLSKTDGEKKNDWTKIVDRAPMMEYAEHLSDSLKGATNDKDAIKDNADQVRREAELLAVLGVVLTQEGMDDFDDSEYKSLSNKMTQAASGVVAALERGDNDAVRKGVGAITQSCDACHEQYR